MLGEKSPDYAIALNNLALLYQYMGAYAKSEKLAKQVLEIDKETLSATNPGHAIHLDNMALLYRAMGDYATPSCFSSKRSKSRSKCWAKNTLITPSR